MNQTTTSRVLCFALVCALLLRVHGSAQQASESTAAPVPTPILVAKRVFISNGGTDCFLIAGGPDRAYNQFYSAMKQWNRYEIAATPADVDLAFELQFSCPIGGVGDGSSSQDPHFRLVIRDLKTNLILWGFTEHVTFPSKHNTYDHNFDVALANLVADVRKLAGSPAPSTGTGH
jgi:hypothetical protein